MKRLMGLIIVSLGLLACGSGSDSSDSVTRVVCTPPVANMAAMGMEGAMPAVMPTQVCEQPLICLANPSNAATGICVPPCASNDQCGGGEVCNVGLCTPTGYLTANMVPMGTMPTAEQGVNPLPMGGMAAQMNGMATDDQAPGGGNPAPADGMGNDGSNLPSPPPGLPGSGSGNGNGGGNNPQPMGGTCIELNQCLVMCGADANCQQGCISRFPQEVVNQVTAISFCAQRSGCGQGDQQCVMTNCACEIGVCQGTQQGPCEGSNPGGCGAIIQCQQGCGGRQQCAQNCFMMADQAAQQLYLAINTCAMDNNCVGAGGAIDPMCLQSNCGNEFNTCLSN